MLASNATSNEQATATRLQSTKPNTIAAAAASAIIKVAAVPAAATREGGTEGGGREMVQQEIALFRDVDSATSFIDKRRATTLAVLAVVSDPELCAAASGSAFMLLPAAA